MLATEILMEEHTVIERMLNALETAANRVSKSEQVRPSFFLDAADFIKNFADGCHHHKEEGVLFVAMGEVGLPARGGPIGVMLIEHEQGRTFTRNMKAAAEKWQSGDLSAQTEVVSNALGYVNLLRQHIHKENTILFPMADRLIPPDRQAKVVEDFETVEHEESGAGVHEKYLALAERLEKEASPAA